MGFFGSDELQVMMGCDVVQTVKFLHIAAPPPTHTHTHTHTTVRRAVLQEAGFFTVVIAVRFFGTGTVPFIKNTCCKVQRLLCWCLKGTGMAGQQW